MKSGSMLKGGEESSRVDILPRHHNDPSPPAPASPQKVCWSLRGCRDTAPSTGLPHRKRQPLLPRHICSKSWLRLLRQKMSRLQMPAAPRKTCKQAGAYRDRDGSCKSRASGTWANHSTSRLQTLLLPCSSWECGGL